MSFIRLFFLFRFITHYLTAKRVDVLHSPFVYRLYTSCIKRSAAQSFPEGDALYRRMLTDTRKITQHDYGSGTLVTREQRVFRIATEQAKSRRILRILASLIREMKYTTGVELGTSLGLSAAFQGDAFRSNGGILHTIEGAKAFAQLASEHLDSCGLQHTVQQHIGQFDDELPQLLPTLSKIDYVFIDGNHRHDPTLQYFHTFLPYMHSKSVMVFDDIRWSKGMSDAWETIKSHPDVTVTVDLFFIGLVFFRKEQAREHFKLRIW